MITTEKITAVWRADGSQRNGTCNRPGNHGGNDHHCIFQIQCKRRFFRIVFPAQLAGKHNGKGLVAGDSGSDDGSQQGRAIRSDPGT